MKQELIQKDAEFNPAQLLQAAVSNNADMSKLEKLMDLRDRWEANEARKAFVSAMAAFKADPPPIRKNKRVSFQAGGDVVSYAHADLAEVCDAVCSALGKHGLSHRWDVSQESATIKVTCIVTHEQGHSETTSLTSVPDQSGKKNAIQQVASTVTYLQRYTLLAALGLAAKGQDDDARGAEIERVSDEQQATIQDTLEAVGADKAKFLAYLKVDSISSIPAKAYDEAIRLLKQRGRKNA